MTATIWRAGSALEAQPRTGRPRTAAIQIESHGGWRAAVLLDQRLYVADTKPSIDRYGELLLILWRAIAWIRQFPRRKSPPRWGRAG